MFSITASFLQDLLRQYGFTIRNSFTEKKNVNLSIVSFVEVQIQHRIMVVNCPYEDRKEQQLYTENLVNQWNKCMEENDLPHRFVLEVRVSYTSMYFHELLKTMSFEEFKIYLNDLMQVPFNQISEHCKVMYFIESLYEDEQMFGASRPFLVQLYADMDHGSFIDTLDETYKNPDYSAALTCAKEVELHYLKSLENKYPSVIPSVLKF